MVPHWELQKDDKENQTTNKPNHKHNRNRLRASAENRITFKERSHKTLDVHNSFVDRLDVEGTSVPRYAGTIRPRALTVPCHGAILVSAPTRSGVLISFYIRP